MKTFEGKFKKNSKGVFAISLVNEPATEETFIAMSKDEVAVKLAKINEEQRILMGLVLQPNQMIYRNDGENEYQMFFSADTIKEYSHNFFKSGFQLNSKLEHDTTIEGVTFVESWLVADPKIDKSATFGMEYPVGSWMVSMKVDNDDIWNNYIKTGELQGFSIDAMVELEEVKEFNLKTNIDMSENKSILTKLKELVLSVETVETVVEEVVEVTMGSAKSGDLDIQFEGETLEEGSSVFLMSDDEKVALADGEYTIDESEDVVSVKDGVVESITPKQEEETPAEDVAVEEKELADEPTEEEAPAEDVPAESVSMDQVAEMIDALRAELEGKLSEVIGMNAELKKEVVMLSAQPVAKAIVTAPTQLSSHGRILDRIKRNK
tara:strand:- start:2079 stop:3215 length:1137 start_codon:yes stop_codon:yes gene_type:complete